MGNSPSRDNINDNSSNNNNSNSNANSTTVSAVSNLDDPDPLPSQLLLSSNNNRGLLTNDNSNTNFSNNNNNNDYNKGNRAIKANKTNKTNRAGNGSSNEGLHSNNRIPKNSSKSSTAKKSVHSNATTPNYELEIGASLAKDLKITINTPKPVNYQNLSSSSESNSDSCFTSNSASSTSSAITSNLNSAKIPLYPIKEHLIESSTPEVSPSSLINENNNSPLLNCNPDLPFKLELSKKSSSSSSTSSTTNSTTLDIDKVIEKLIENGLSKKSSKKFLISNEEIKLICAKARNIFLNQPMLLELASPVKIVGDIHGQFLDLLRIFKLCGFPPNSNYLFLGDYVDRGKQSLETIILLFCLKIKYPENFFMLRGNHESASITKMYGFYDECKRRCNLKVWKNFIDVFNTLPVAATIADKIFCVHGGLSPQLSDLNQIKQIQRPTDIPEEGLLADLLWSDPQYEKEDSSNSTSNSGSSSSSNSNSNSSSSSNSNANSNSNSNSNSNANSNKSLNQTFSDWSDNDRGVSYCFNKRIINKFCHRFGFDLIARGHMVVEQGYEFYDKRRLVTIFSAPNYCGEFNNWGAVMNVNKKLMCSFELLKPKEIKKRG